MILMRRIANTTAPSTNAATLAVILGGGTPAHADYPHLPGHLFDCPACEAACNCVLGRMESDCVFEGPHHGGRLPAGTDFALADSIFTVLVAANADDDHAPQRDTFGRLWDALTAWFVVEYRRAGHPAPERAGLRAMETVMDSYQSPSSLAEYLTLPA